MTISTIVFVTKRLLFSYRFKMLFSASDKVIFSFFNARIIIPIDPTGTIANFFQLLERLSHLSGECLLKVRGKDTGSLFLQNGDTLIHFFSMKSERMFFGHFFV
ncbi:hypothetical protein B6D60_04845 [candidate division KSB1 bacterium 4484_87]|nr:MAG: hypothetical protein B6D60_04845 [candidate division KSB1 bacterium 4484_87]